jgi:hypothetical protein
MASAGGGYLRENAFLVAAVALPAVVAGFFILATAVPRWTVADPEYDLVLRVARSYDAAPAKVAVEFSVRNGQVQATVQRAPANGYTQPWSLFLFEHETMSVREIPLDLPTDLGEGESRTLTVDALASRRIDTAVAAPDGYELMMHSSGGGGLVGDIFGMGRYRQTLALVNQGRVVPIVLPTAYQTYSSPAYPLGWVMNDVRR